MAAGDGIDSIDDDGTVHLIPASQKAVADIAPELAEPIAIDDLTNRAARLDSVLTQLGCIRPELPARTP
ncbi:hypothetical protein [Actinopolyspora halophila]|uniref:hypothetical protein n=1 Tax=Actinopolyspora halophila TaxID=1850 RepID=UPI00036243AC|nr:hypothetical protein [Actinopolyspora halophila]